MKIGLVGCGVISTHYAQNAQAFDSFELAACADVDPDRAAALGAAHGLDVLAVDELIADPALELVLNLTPPSAHLEVSRRALAAGKHVYSEKPLAPGVEDGIRLLAEADQRGLRVGCAPDIFLGSAYQAARVLLDGGAIGEPLSVSAAMHTGGAETWHPNPEFFYAPGAGPMLDMGPYYLTAIAALLGPVRRVAGFAVTRRPEREIGSGPRAGERFAVSVATQVAATLELESGATANLVTSFDAPGQYVCDFVIHGSDGQLALPDPNSFGGVVLLRHGREDWHEVAYSPRGGHDARGIGVHDLVEAIAVGRRHRASGTLALHVVDVAHSILRAADEGRTVEVVTSCDLLAPLPV